MEGLLSLSAAELGRAIRTGKTTAVEAMQAVLDQIEKTEETYHCYVTVDRENALKKAKEVQKKIESGELSGPLSGVPAAVKDNLCTEGMRTTCSSRILGNFVPTYSADAVRKLEQAGVVLIGKTNMDEFAMGSTTETSAYGPTRNPHNPEHVPGGSSGGSAAAVAAGECFFALGTDTGGSIRQPASHCGVVGMKPTYGTISRYGMIAYGSSLDQIGSLCKTVEDCAVILEVLAGQDGEQQGTHPEPQQGIQQDPRQHIVSGGQAQQQDRRQDTCRDKATAVTDSTLLRRTDTDFTSALKKDVAGMRIGIPYIPASEKNPYTTPEDIKKKKRNESTENQEGLNPEVESAIRKAAKLLRANGAIVEEFALDLVDYAIPAYYTIAAAEASSNLERFDGVKYGYRAEEAKELHQMYKETRSQGFGAEVKRRIMLGSFVLSSGYYDAYYLKALRVRAMIKKAFDEAFRKYDCILGPAAPTTAPKLGESLADPLKMYLSDIYTISVNLAGLPAISVPCGVDAAGLPIGLQLIGDCFQEKKLLQIAYTYEQLRLQM